MLQQFCVAVCIYIPFKIVSYARLAFLIISRSLCLSLSRLATHVLLSIFCGLVGLLVNCYVPAFQCVQVFGFSWGYRVHLLFQTLLLSVLLFLFSPRYRTNTSALILEGVEFIVCMGLSICLTHLFPPSI